MTCRNNPNKKTRVRSPTPPPEWAQSIIQHSIKLPEEQKKMDKHNKFRPQVFRIEALKILLEKQDMALSSLGTLPEYSAHKAFLSKILELQIQHLRN